MVKATILFLDEKYIEQKTYHNVIYIISRKAYSEIYEILNLMEAGYVDKVPNKFKELIISEKDNSFKPNIKIDIPLESQNLQKDTLTILAILYLNYWYESEQEKEELIKLFNEVDKQNAEKYSIDNIFKKRQNVKNTIGEDTNISLIEYKENFFLKLVNRLKRLLKIQ